MRSGCRSRRAPVTDWASADAGDRAAAEEADHLLRRLCQVVARGGCHQCALYSRVDFIVTNLSRPSERVVKLYKSRGMAERWIKQGKNALPWMRSPCWAF